MLYKYQRAKTVLKWSTNFLYFSPWTFDNRYHLKFGLGMGLWETSKSCSGCKGLKYKLSKCSNFNWFLHGSFAQFGICMKVWKAKPNVWKHRMNSEALIRKTNLREETGFKLIADISLKKFVRFSNWVVKSRIGVDIWMTKLYFSHLFRCEERSTCELLLKFWRIMY